jgi:hypothetical protein
MRTKVVLISSLLILIIICGAQIREAWADASGDIVWVEDSLPAGATPTGTNDLWNWISTNPKPYSGALSNQSNLFSGLHQQYFYGATDTLRINTGEVLIAYVYLDPNNPPTEIMLQWNNSSGSWEHRAYWGANDIDLGEVNTESRRYMGPLPALGEWVRLEVPADEVGLEGETLNGMAFSLFNGRATWDHAGKSTQLSPTPTPTPTPTPGLNLMDFGAAGDGLTDDGPALQRALDALAEAGGGTLIVPAGHYAILTPVSKDFTGLASSVRILGVESSTPVDPTGTPPELSRGLNLLSEFLPKTGREHAAFGISGLQKFLIKDISFMGTPDVATDAVITLGLERIEDATVRHCEFYGLSTQAGGAIIAASKSGLKIEQSKFLGSTCNSGVYSPVVENTQWKSIAVTDTVFLDYGQRAEIFTKTGYGAPFSWINIGNAEAVVNDSPRREVVIRNVFLDEGGFVGISSNPNRYQPPSAPIDLIYISGLSMNVSNLGTTGNYLNSPRSVFIENAHYGWSHNTDSAISLINVGNAIIDRAECLASANRIRADAATGRLSVINSIYTYLDSLAQTTKVITTETIEDDPVQYVRQRYETLLGREPDPAGHYYWSDLILRCGDDAQCLADVRAAFDSYLDNAPSANFSIAGQVTDENGDALQGVTLTLGGSQAVTTQTDAKGQYSFSNLPTSGVYTVSPSKTHYTFGAPLITIKTPSGNETVNFTATLNRHTIRGRLTNDAGNSIANATMTLSGSGNATATTDAGGNYSFPNLPAGGTYTLTPSKSTYAFSPSGQTIANLGSDQTANFTLITYQISGRVARADGSGVAGVILTLSGSESGVTTSDANGNYLLANLPAGGSYTVTPARASNTFAPSGRTLNSLSSNQTANFTATLDKYTVGGRITLNGLGLEGVTVTLSGSQTGTATTDVNGDYKFSLTAEGDYTITPTKNHYTFAPESQRLNLLTGNRTVDFAGNIKRHTITGRVANASNYSVPGVIVTLSGSQSATATTDANGYFSFTNLAAGGTYNVTPALSYHSFNPRSKTFSDLGSDQYTDFSVSLNHHTVSGRVTKADGAGIPGVTMNLAGTQGGTTTTDAGGNYSFANLPAGGNYLITLAKSNYSFAPLSRTVNNLSADQTANFAGTLVSYQISGRVTLSGTAMSGVTITISGSQTATATTDANGGYSFTVQAEGNYILTPSKTNYNFAPQNIGISNLSGNQIGNFAAKLNQGVPVLVSQQDSTRALALDSILRLPEPFQLSYSYPWITDRRTRVMLYAMNFELLPGESLTVVRAEMEDASHRIYPLTVEYVGKVPEISWLNRIIVRLNDDLGDVGDVLVKITYRGIASNRVRLAIGHIGGGLPDEAGSVPTPGSPPQ